MSKPTTALDRLERLLEYDGGEGFRVFADNEAGIDLRAVCAALRSAMRRVPWPIRVDTPFDEDTDLALAWLGGCDLGHAAGVRLLRRRIRAELAKAEEPTDE